MSPVKGRVCRSVRLRAVVASALLPLLAMGSVACGSGDDRIASAPTAASPEAENGPGVATAQRLNLPKVEIFSNQLPILIFRGELRAVPVTGNVYDMNFNGTIKLEPNGPASTACPIFFQDSPALGGFVQLGGNAGFTRAGLLLRAPNNATPGTYNCALRYSAIHQILTLGNFSVGFGNQVNVQYTIHR